MKANWAHVNKSIGIRARFTPVLVSGLCLLSTFCVSLQAQEESEDENVLEEILVTASKRGEISAQDLAGAITAFDGKKLDRLKALDFDDLIVQVPSTNFINDGR